MNKEEIKKHLETYENENTVLQNMGHIKSSSKREVYDDTGPPQEMTTKKSQINNPNLYLRQPEKKNKVLS